ncbi:hypothetical protein [Paenarthrobacter nicotinovorans]|uniref:hypothetical protein n=1 Tax=Paenarthrobacter nicotinovorans TaxID=29320 RepID=UPI003749D255
MPVATPSDNGFTFEAIALSIVKAIHDPSGQQGAIMHGGQERDALFIDSQSITAYEFTTARTVDKARKDGTKLAGLLRDLTQSYEHKFKSSQGFFVTDSEPTAEQRQAIQAISRAQGVVLHAIGLGDLRKRLIEADKYIDLRMRAPFGSTNYGFDSKAHSGTKYVEPNIDSALRNKVELDQVLLDLNQGRRFVLIGDYGSGKSEALHQAFIRQRRLYFKNPGTVRIPIHMNLRDLFGLRSPREIFQRHAEEIGFPEDRQLMSAWRAGAVQLFLDGFDELIPSRWTGGARDLKNVRKQALAAVATLIRETPPESGILISGRAQYFSGITELVEVLQIGDAEVLSLLDFDSSQALEFLGNSELALPDWVPTRPLLLNFLLDMGMLETGTWSNSLSKGDVWRDIVHRISARESLLVSGITTENVRMLLCRTATIARKSSGGLGPVSLDDMRSVFLDVCGFEADEEGVQTLLRLPGLTTATAEDSLTSFREDASHEARVFVDQDLADASYGLDLASYAVNPYDAASPLSRSSWVNGSGEFPSEIAAAEFMEHGFHAAQATAALRHRLDQGFFDSVALDLVRLSGLLDAPFDPKIKPEFREVLIPALAVGGNAYLAHSVFYGCLIQEMDTYGFGEDEDFPAFSGCMIEEVHGWSQIPAEVARKFSTDSLIDKFTGGADNTNTVLALALPETHKIALTILRKIYAQSGNGRRYGALVRGLPMKLRPEVKAVVQSLVSSNWIFEQSSKSDGIYGAVGSRRTDVRKMLENPASTADLLLL